ncbi:MAG: hypothetical protein M1524_02280 [Patescibacteria group bacterium]|nr:hypothetical protein [Patescibacteria group bacterium]
MEGHEIAGYHPRQPEKKGLSRGAKILSAFAGLTLAIIGGKVIKDSLDKNPPPDAPTKKIELTVSSSQQVPELAPDPNFPRSEAAKMYEGPATEVLEGATLIIKKGDVNFRKDGPFVGPDNAIESGRIKKINGTPVGDVIVIKNPAIKHGQKVDGAGGSDPYGDWLVVDKADLSLLTDQDHLWFSLSDQTKDYWTLEWEPGKDGGRSDAKSLPANRVNIIVPQEQLAQNK